MSRPLTTVELDRRLTQGCSNPDCHNPKCGEENVAFLLHGSCHPHAPSFVSYTKGGKLSMECGVCRRPIIQVEVASKNSPAVEASAAAADLPIWKRLCFQAGESATLEMLCQAGNAGVWFTQAQQECSRLACLVAASQAVRLVAADPDALQLLEAARADS